MTAADLVPVPVSDVAVVDLGDTAALVSPTGGVLEVDPRTQMLWSLFDGVVTLGELADDIVAVFDGAAHDPVLADLERLHATLLAHGMLLSTDGAPRATGSQPPDTVTLPPPCCGNRLSDETWRSTFVCRVGDRRIGLRTENAAVEGALLDLLGPLVEGEELTDVPPNISLILRLPDEDRPGPELQLHSQQRLIASSGSATHIRTALLIELAVLAAEPAGALHVDAFAVGRADGVVLLPTPSYRPAMRFLWGALADRGLAIGSARAAVDADRREVVVGAIDAPGGGEGIRRFDQLVDWTHTGPGLLPPGRYPIRAIGVRPHHLGDAGPLPPVDELRLAASLVATIDHDDFPGRLATARRLLASVDTTAPDAQDIAAWFDTHLGSPP